MKPISPDKFKASKTLVTGLDDTHLIMLKQNNSIVEEPANTKHNLSFLPPINSHKTTTFPFTPISNHILDELSNSHIEMDKFEL